MDKVHYYPKGTALILTRGEYSDFGVCSTLVTIEDCDLPKLARDFISEVRSVPPTETEFGASFYDDGPEEFAAWLVVKGFAMPMKAETAWLGSYGNLTIGDEANNA